jgi:hypothetical protein
MGDTRNAYNILVGKSKGQSKDRKVDISKNEARVRIFPFSVLSFQTDACCSKEYFLLFYTYLSSLYNRDDQAQIGQ